MAWFWTDGEFEAEMILPTSSFFLRSHRMITREGWTLLFGVWLATDWITDGGLL